MKGRITKMNAYKDKTGYFIGIDNAPIDHAFFGSLGREITVGAQVIYEEGQKKLGNHPTLKYIKLDAGEAYIDEDKPRSAPILRAHDVQKMAARDEYWTNKERRDLEREPIITRLSCISSAVEMNSNATTEGVIEAAKRFERYAKDGV